MAKQEYQYHLKVGGQRRSLRSGNHLGNVRLTFTTEDLLNTSTTSSTSTYLATMEPEYSTLEESTFNNLESTRQADVLYNHTEGGNSSARLNAYEGRIMGPGMSLHVMPGDTVTMTVYAKYDEPASEKEAITGIASIVAAAFTGGGATEAPLITQAINEALGTGQLALFSRDNTIPKAYLNYLFFDTKMIFKKGGFTQVSTEAHGKFETIEMEYVAEEEGYLMTYTANETNEDLNVYMDDMTVTHTEGPIIRVDDYFPFGLTFNSSQLDGKLTNKYLYNGKEMEELTDWYDYGARMYDGVVGRWRVVRFLKVIIIINLIFQLNFVTGFNIKI